MDLLTSVNPFFYNSFTNSFSPNNSFQWWPSGESGGIRNYLYMGPRMLQFSQPALSPLRCHLNSFRHKNTLAQLHSQGILLLDYHSIESTGAVSNSFLHWELQGIHARRKE